MLCYGIVSGLEGSQHWGRNRCNSVLGHTDSRQALPAPQITYLFKDLCKE